MTFTYDGRTVSADYPYSDLGVLPTPLPMPVNSPCDQGIEYAVRVLRYHGIETYESCEGGEGHAFTEPTVRFHGGAEELYRAYAAARLFALPVREIRRFWEEVDGELVGPECEITFWEKVVKS